VIAVSIAKSGLEGLSDVIGTRYYLSVDVSIARYRLEGLSGKSGSNPCLGSAWIATCSPAAWHVARPMHRGMNRCMRAMPGALAGAALSLERQAGGAPIHTPREAARWAVSGWAN
jgi:hypothetical protein